MAYTPEHEDPKVIEAACLALLRDADFRKMSRLPSDQIVLVERPAEKIGILSRTQIETDLASDRLTSELIEGLWLRNQSGSGWDSRRASFRGWSKDKRIQIGPLPKPNKSYLAEISFTKTYPKATGWFQPFLPAYSDDERIAVVRGWVGPSPHGATATILLQRDGAGWIALWVRIARYV